MKRIETTVKINGVEYHDTFRVNSNGEYMFTGVHENRQISTDHFATREKMGKKIREYLQEKYEHLVDYDRIPKIKYDCNF